MNDSPRMLLKRFYQVIAIAAVMLRGTKRRGMGFS